MDLTCDIKNLGLTFNRVKFITDEVSSVTSFHLMQQVYAKTHYYEIALAEFITLYARV